MYAGDLVAGCWPRPIFERDLHSNLFSLFLTFFFLKILFGAPVWGPPVWGVPPQIKDAVPAPPQTAVPAPLPAPIWEAPVELL